MHYRKASNSCSAGDQQQGIQGNGARTNAQQRNRDGGKREENQQRCLAAPTVCDETTGQLTEQSTDVHDQQEGNARTQRIATAIHELWQPGVQAVHHEHAHTKGNPDHQGSECTRVAEQRSHGRSRSIGYDVDLVLGAADVAVVRIDTLQQCTDIIVALFVHQVRHRFRERFIQQWQAKQ
ncbi:hypothetical protein D3C79_849120 [compost metagenome]